VDQHLRRLEREAADGDYDAIKAYKHALMQAGYPDPDQEELEAPPSEAELWQQYYDDMAYQGRPWKGLLSMWCGLGCCGCVAKQAKKLIKGKDWGFYDKQPLAKNSKRKTLRTHRDPRSRRGRLTR